MRHGSIELRDPAGALIGAVNMLVDITARKLAEWVTLGVSSATILGLMTYLVLDLTEPDSPYVELVATPTYARTLYMCGNYQNAIYVMGGQASAQPPARRCPGSRGRSEARCPREGRRRRPEGGSASRAAPSGSPGSRSARRRS